MRSPAATWLPAYVQSMLDYIEKPERLVVGLLSGTSADGVSVVLVRISGQDAETSATVVGCETYPYPSPLDRRVFDLFARETATVDRIAQADNEIGEAFAAAAIWIAEKCGHSISDVDMIASSGQITYQVIEGQRDETGIGVILEFPTVDAAKAWISDPDLAATHALRRAAGDCAITLLA